MDSNSHAAAVAAAAVSVLLLLVPGRGLAWNWASFTNGEGEEVYYLHFGNCVSWSLNERGCDNIEDFDLVHEAVRRSFQSWNSVGCSYIKFIEAPVTSCDCRNIGYNQGGSNANIVVWCEDYWSSQYPPSAVAITAVAYDNVTGEILDADIAVNGASFVFGIVNEATCENETDVQNTLSHEAGHMLGFDESDVDNATMYGYTHVCETEKRSLEEDDINGVCTMYPLDEDPGECKSPIGGLEDCRDGCGCRFMTRNDSSRALLVSIFMLLAFFLFAATRKKFSDRS